jgi:hypothetical protein
MNELITTSLFSASSFELSLCPLPDRVRRGVRQSPRNAANLAGTARAFCSAIAEPGDRRRVQILRKTPRGTPIQRTNRRQFRTNASFAPPIPGRNRGGSGPAGAEAGRNRFNGFCSKSASSLTTERLTTERKCASGPNLPILKNLSRGRRRSRTSTLNRAKASFAGGDGSDSWNDGFDPWGFRFLG